MPRSLRAGMMADAFFFFVWSSGGAGTSSAFEEAEEWPEAVEESVVGAWAVAEAFDAALLGSTYLTLIRILFRRAAGEGRISTGLEGVSMR